MLQILKMQKPYSATMTELLKTMSELSDYLRNDEYTAEDAARVGAMQSALGVLLSQAETLALAEQIVHKDPGAAELLTQAEATAMLLIEKAKACFASAAKDGDHTSH